MIKKINRYRYSMALSILLSIFFTVRLDHYTLDFIAMIFLLTWASFTLLHLLIAVIFDAKLPAYFNYEEDIFYNIQWNWHWNFKKEILHLSPCCPTCKSEIYTNFDTLVYKTEVLCEKCNKQLATINSSDRNFVVDSVKKSIIRKLKKEDPSF